MILTPLLLVASLGFGAASRLSVERSLSLSLQGRQTSSGTDNNFPPQCSSQCTPSQNLIDSCPNDACFCTAANFDTLRTCFQCVGDLLGNIPATQAILNQLISNCTSEGFDLPPETLTTGSSSNGVFPTGDTSSSGSSNSSILSTTPASSTSTKPLFTAPTSTPAPTTSTNNSAIFGNSPGASSTSSLAPDLIMYTISATLLSTIGLVQGFMF